MEKPAKGQTAEKKANEQVLMSTLPKGGYPERGEDFIPKILNNQRTPQSLSPPHPGDPVRVLPFLSWDDTEGTGFSSDFKLLADVPSVIQNPAGSKAAVKA